MKKKSCTWPNNDKLMIEYHDKEWGVPLHDDKKLFEFMVLDAFQAGLSWAIVLKKKEAFRKAFSNYDVKKIAKYDEKKVAELLNNEGIIRNKMKILAAIKNAQAFINVQKEFGSFDKYIWQFTKNKTIVNKCKTIKEIPPKTEISDAMSKDLKQRGFGFVGSTICYSFMQAAGMVNDHVVECFRYKEVQRINN
ncbi:MAG: DNA-3-methyladenine glycosylase [Ignavibacteria bacterium GWB2_35_12]|nr:MAG: DNA-3-methyladenine glycosylase [Ignavibacteria bacterium GWB2_35_12]OGU87396.1 MAG: DNA-3-methyladenine glycosylase [Ignavibacteria bacterium RIFOXYA2_FULL_35_10]OGV22041.1 MAG: DNA-3-methyladenine glycosylase [Ignavibacteria bacterium RIFOXYC2_FULL_35_21]